MHAGRSRGRRDVLHDVLHAAGRPLRAAGVPHAVVRAHGRRAGDRRAVEGARHRARRDRREPASSRCSRSSASAPAIARRSSASTTTGTSASAPKTSRRSSTAFERRAPAALTGCHLNVESERSVRIAHSTCHIAHRDIRMDHFSPSTSASRTASRSTSTRSTAGYGALKKALGDDAGRGRSTPSRRRACAGAAAPDFRPGMKWQFVDKKSPKPKYICCNADESEPGTFKDHVLMERNPHLLFEGCLIGCYAIGAKVAYIYIRGEFYHVQEVLEAEIEKARAAGFIGKNIFGSGLRLRDLRASRRRRLRGRRRDRAHRVARRASARSRASSRRSRRSPACTAARRPSTTSRRSATCRSSSSAAPSGSRRSVPRRTAGRSSTASAATSRSPASTRRRCTRRCAS